eukprot:2132507-Heterocapsa_arctica.AAC.1
MHPRGRGPTGVEGQACLFAQPPAPHGQGDPASGGLACRGPAPWRRAAPVLSSADLLAAVVGL